MSQKATCINDADFEITEGTEYQVMEYDQVLDKIKIQDDKGNVIWVSAHCFLGL